jgi:hypothetical protein
MLIFGSFVKNSRKDVNGFASLLAQFVKFLQSDLRGFHTP